jgi:hypothetical protein
LIRKSTGVEKTAMVKEQYKRRPALMAKLNGL